MSDWTEPTGPARGAVVVAGGRGETAAVYGRLSARLTADGYRVTVVAPVADLATGRERGEDEVEAAVRAAIADAGATEPVVVIGSDTGAALAVRIAASAPAALAGVVLAGLPTAQAGSPAGWDDEVEARSACRVHRGVLAEAVAAGRLATATAAVTAEALAHVEVPALAIHGEADPIFPAAAAAAAAGALPRGTTVVVAGGLHDVLNDVGHRSVAAEIVQFLERLRLPGAPLILRREPAHEPEDALPVG